MMQLQYVEELLKRKRSADPKGTIFSTTRFYLSFLNVGFSAEARASSEVLVADTYVVMAAHVLLELYAHTKVRIRAYVCMFIARISLLNSRYLITLASLE